MLKIDGAEVFADVGVKGGNVGCRGAEQCVPKGESFVECVVLLFLL